MSRLPGEPLTRVTLNLFSEDLDMLKRYHQSGYQLVIRQLVHEYVQSMNREAEDTLGTLERMYK